MNFTGFMFDDLWLPNISANSWRSRRVPLTKPQNLQMTSSRKNKSRRVCGTAAVVKYFSCFCSIQLKVHAKILIHRTKSSWVSIWSASLISYSIQIANIFSTTCSVAQTILLTFSSRLLSVIASIAESFPSSFPFHVWRAYGRYAKVWLQRILSWIMWHWVVHARVLHHDSHSGHVREVFLLHYVMRRNMSLSNSIWERLDQCFRINRNKLNPKWVFSALCPAFLLPPKSYMRQKNTTRRSLLCNLCFQLWWQLLTWHFRFIDFA